MFVNTNCKKKIWKVLDGFCPCIHMGQDQKWDVEYHKRFQLETVQKIKGDSFQKVFFHSLKRFSILCPSDDLLRCFLLILSQTYLYGLTNEITDSENKIWLCWFFLTNIFASSCKYNWELFLKSGFLLEMIRREGERVAGKLYGFMGEVSRKLRLHRHTNIPQIFSTS